MIFGGGLVNLAMNLGQRHPIVRERTLINYEALLILTPLLLAGTTIGVIGNTLLPSWLLVLFLLAFLSLATHRMLRNGMRKCKAANRRNGRRNAIEQQKGLSLANMTRPRLHAVAGGAGDTLLFAVGPTSRSRLAAVEAEEEEEEDRARSERGAESLPRSTTGPAQAAAARGMVMVVSPLTRAFSSEHTEMHGEQVRLEPGGAEAHMRTEKAAHTHAATTTTPGLVSFAVAEVVASEEEARGVTVDGRGVVQQLERLIAQDREQVRPLACVLALLLLLLTSSLLRGGRGGSRSLIGVHACSSVWWLLLIGALFGMAGLTAAFGSALRARHRLREAVGYKLVEGDVRWTRRNTAMYPLVAGVAGVVGGLLGVGGGMIIGPLLLELGLLPQVTSATSALAVLVSSAAGTMQFLLMGLLVLDRAAWYCALGMLATYVGQTCVNALVRRFNSAAVVVFAIALVMFVSTVLMGVVGVVSTVRDVREGRSVGLRSVC